MKTKLLIVFAFCTFNLFSQTNLILNGGFETWTNSTTLSNWTIENSVTQNTFLPAKGSYSANLSLSSSLIPKISIPVSLVAGTTYIVKYKYKYLDSNFGGTHPITLSIQNGGNTSLTNSSFASNNSWTQKQTTFTADQTIAYDLSISINSFDAEFFGVSIDEVQIYAESDEKYTLIPDPKFEDELIYQLLDSGPRDGRVVTSNISELVSLDVSFLNITNLTGIQDFVGLKTLNCSFNNLTSLNLSKNLLLQELNVKNCKLTSLDLSKNVALKKINCQYNQLTSLNVKNGNNTLLTSQDLFFKFNTNLSCIQVDDVAYSNTNWSTQKEATAEFNTSCAPFTLIPDVNFENKLIALGIDSAPADGKVLTSSINTLISLNVSNSSINDLTGIQDFVALKELNCGRNQLTNLNVTKNVALTDLYCFYNQIKSIDVSQNSKLVSFMCHFNELTSINVSNNPKLDLFDCLNNKITSLDISKNPLITELACENNQLTYLNLKNGANTILDLTFSNFVNNPNLTCIQVDDVAYSNAKWGSKKDATATYNTDCQQYTLIPDANFEKKLITLGIDSGATDGKVLTNNVNKLTTLDVSSSSITDLTGIQDFVALTTLDCSRNQLTTLNVTKNITLNSLSCTFNQLTTLDISKNVTLTDFNCSYNQLISLDVSKNLALNSFSCASNKLTSLEVSKNVGLTYFICHSNQLNTLNVSKNVALNTFACGQNQLTSLDVSKNLALIDLGCNANQLTTLDVSKNLSLNSFHCSANQLIILDVSKNVALDTFSCRENQLTTLDVSKNVALTFLHCSNNQLAYLDVSKDVALTYLNCSSNNLSALNLKNTKNTLLTNPNIDLSGNPNLSCILVDEATYSKAYWADKKDATATYSSTCGTLRIEDSVFDKIAIYPNPTKGELHIDNIILKKATVYDALGKLVKTTTFTSGANDNTIHLTGLPKGVYYVYLESEGANTAKKIIVE